MFISLLANRFRIFTEVPKPPCCSVCLLFYTGGFSEASSDLTPISGGFRKASFSSKNALEQLFHMTARGLMEMYENSKAVWER
jgi:hypothetical protein